MDTNKITKLFIITISISLILVIMSSVFEEDNRAIILGLSAIFIGIGVFDYLGFFVKNNFSKKLSILDGVVEKKKCEGMLSDLFINSQKCYITGRACKKTNAGDKVILVGYTVNSPMHNVENDFKVLSYLNLTNNVTYQKNITLNVIFIIGLIFLAYKYIIFLYPTINKEILFSGEFIGGIFMLAASLILFSFIYIRGLYVHFKSNKLLNSVVKNKD